MSKARRIQAAIRRPALEAEVPAALDGNGNVSTEWLVAQANKPGQLAPESRSSLGLDKMQK